MGKKRILEQIKIFFVVSRILSYYYPRPQRTTRLNALGAILLKRKGIDTFFINKLILGMFSQEIRYMQKGLLSRFFYASLTLKTLFHNYNRCYISIYNN